MTRASTCLAVSLAVWAAAAASAAASFPGRNGEIAYLWIGESAYRAGPTATSIRAVDPRTGTVRVLRDCPLRRDQGVPYTDCALMAPAWAPGGSTLAFPMTLITPSFTGEAWRFDPALGMLSGDGTSSQERRTAHRYVGASWSPAGDQLLMERELRETGPSAGPGLFLASLEGAELRQVGPDLGHGADWSSRGAIAFARYRDTSCLPVCNDVYIMRPGGTPRRLTYRGGSTPSWSPGGTKLVFARPSGGQLNLFVVRRNGRGLRRLTRHGGYNPVWSPDGRWIAFVRNGDLLVIRPNGDDRRRLVKGMASPGLGDGPQVQALDWRALPRR